MSGAPTHRKKDREINPRHQEWTLRAARGETYQKIATEVGVSVGSVGAAVRRAEKILAAEFRGSAQRQKFRITQTFQQVVQKSFESYELSLRDDVSEESGMTANGPISKEKSRRRDGDTSHLSVAINAASKIAHLWGFDLPEDKSNAEEGFRWAGATEAELMDEEIRRLTRERADMKIEAT